MPIDSNFLTIAAQSELGRTKEAWGEESVTLDTIGGVYQFLGLNRRQAEVIRTIFHLTPHPPAQPRPIQCPDIIATFYRAPVQYFLFPRTNRKYLQSDIHSSAAGLELVGPRFYTKVYFTTPIKAEIWATSDGDELTFGSLIFQNVFRVLAAYRIFLNQGLTLHCAGITDGNSAHLFLGHSRAGKSTISRLSLEEGHSVLSDDLNAVWPENGRLVTSNIPFTGVYAQHADITNPLPVAALYILTQAPKHRLLTVTPARMASKAFANAPFLNSDKIHYPTLMDRIIQMVATVPCYELEFSLSPGVWAVIAEGVRT